MLISVVLLSRSTRETTPCSLIRDVDVATPGSSTAQRQKKSSHLKRVDFSPSGKGRKKFNLSALLSAYCSALSRHPVLPSTPAFQVNNEDGRADWWDWIREEYCLESF